MSNTPDLRAQFQGQPLGVEGALAENGTQPFRIRALQSGVTVLSEKETAVIRAAWKSLNALSRARYNFHRSQNPR